MTCHQLEQPSRAAGGRRSGRDVVPRAHHEPPERLALQIDRHFGMVNRYARPVEIILALVRLLRPGGRGASQRLAVDRANANGHPQDRNELVLKTLQRFLSQVVGK